MRTASFQSTEHLIAAAGRQDDEAVVELIGRCGESIAAGLQSAGLRRTDALYEDAQNQALLAIWQQFPSFRGESSPCTWMYQIARRTAISRTLDAEVRERRRRERDMAMTPTTDLIDSGRDNELAEHDLLAQVLRALSRQDREILHMRVVQELSTQETAELLFLSEGGVKSRLRRAKANALALVRQFELER